MVVVVVAVVLVTVTVFVTRIFCFNGCESRAISVWVVCMVFTLEDCEER